MAKVIRARATYCWQCGLIVMVDPGWERGESRPCPQCCSPITRRVEPLDFPEGTVTHLEIPGIPEDEC